jgi:hypothetical protein
VAVALHRRDAYGRTPEPPTGAHPGWILAILVIAHNWLPCAGGGRHGCARIRVGQGGRRGKGTQMRRSGAWLSELASSGYLQAWHSTRDCALGSWPGALASNFIDASADVRRFSQSRAEPAVPGLPATKADQFACVGSVISRPASPAGAPAAVARWHMTRRRSPGERWVRLSSARMTASYRSFGRGPSLVALSVCSQRSFQARESAGVAA